MPTYQLQAIFIRIGLALAAGVLIAIVPVALRKTRYEPSIPKRVFFYVLALVALVGFGFYASYLWNRFVPRPPEAPAPVAYPAAPAAPAAPPSAAP
jgi:energy-converting hydrogenase Eha subunit F